MGDSRKRLCTLCGKGIAAQLPTQYASIYCRQGSTIEWVDGPLPLELAAHKMDHHAKDALRLPDVRGINRIVYYELRGHDVCRVRYRLWVEYPAPYLRTEVLTTPSPGRRTDNSRGR